MAQEMEILQGTIAAVVYQNYDNGYAVLRLKCKDGQTVTVVGTIPMPAVGESLMVTGKWISHASFGRQFEAEFLERMLPRTSMDILSYLSGRIIKGIGPRTAARIVDKFGDPGLISFRMDWLDLLAVQGTRKSLLQHHSSKASILRRPAFLTVQLSRPSMTIGKTIALTRRTFVGKVMSLVFNMLSRLVITFLPRSKRLLISWLQSPSAVILEPRKIKSDTVSTVSLSISHEVMGPDAMIFVF